GQVLRPWAHGTFIRSVQALAQGDGALAGPNGDGTVTQSADGQARPDGHGTVGQPAGTVNGGDGTVGGRADALSRLNGHGAYRELPRAGEIWVCKLGWWDQAPWDVRAYAEGHSTYPCDSTLQQLYDGAEFEAYHELGSSAVRAAAAAKVGGLPLPIPLAECDGVRLRSHAGIPW